MKLTPYLILLFLVAVNGSLYLLNQLEVLPYYKQGTYDPQQMQSKLVAVDVSLNSLALGGIGLGMGIIGGLIAKNLLAGGTVGLILFAISVFLPIIKWALFGIPEFMLQMGVPTVFVAVVYALIAVPYVWFVLGFVSSRTMYVES